MPDIYIPNVISVSQLARLLGIKLGKNFDNGYHLS